MEVKKPIMVRVDRLIVNEDNPNVMTEKELNKLCENIVNMGFTEPLIVAKVDSEKGDYEVVGGHHRLKAAKSLGLEEVPCIPFDDWNKEKRDMMMVRLNVVKGKLSAKKFVELFQKYADKYGEDMVKDMMGFADESALHDLIDAVSKGLPDEMKKKMKTAEEKGEIDTVDSLEHVLATMFSKFGDTVPANFMFFVHGDRKHVMQKADDDLWKTAEEMYAYIRDNDLDSMEVFKKLLSGWRSACEQ